MVFCLAETDGFFFPGASLYFYPRNKREHGLIQGAWCLPMRMDRKAEDGASGESLIAPKPLNKVPGKKASVGRALQWHLRILE